MKYLLTIATSKTLITMTGAFVGTSASHAARILSPPIRRIKPLPISIHDNLASSSLHMPIDTQLQLQTLPQQQLLASSESIASASTTVPTTTFDPIAPDVSTMTAYALIVILCSVAAWVWANQVVPVSRTKLALSKKNGVVRDYLDELQQSTRSIANTTTTLSQWDTQRDVKVNENVSENCDSSNSKDRAFERWLFTDWLEKPVSSKSGRKKPSALPILKDAKWNSGDNPVLAATALILMGVVLTSVLERIPFLLHI